MITRILIIGGYGNFGSFIAKELAREQKIQLIIAGRSLSKANDFIAELEAVNPAESHLLDIKQNLKQTLTAINADIVIHTSGPFQSQSYDVAEACIELQMHYIDLADGRDFVSNISTLEQAAKDQQVSIISGASSVPCLTSALVDHYIQEFASIDTLDYGITTAQKTTRGLATTAAILAYTGKPFKTLIAGSMKNIYGWQGLHLRKYKGLGWRFLCNCDVPDLTLFPQRYPDLKTIHFYAGLEIKFVHLTLCLLSWLVRLGLIKNLQAAAPLLLRISFLFDWLGTDSSGFHLELTGKDNKGLKKSITFELTAKSGDGPYIPCTPAILLAKKMSNDHSLNFGAYPCVGLISQDEYLQALSEMDISWTIE